MKEKNRSMIQMEIFLRNFNWRFDLFCYKFFFNIYIYNETFEKNTVLRLHIKWYNDWILRFDWFEDCISTKLKKMNLIKLTLLKCAILLDF